MERKATVTLPAIGRGRVTRKRYTGGTSYIPQIAVHVWDGGDEFTHPSLTVKWIQAPTRGSVADPESYVAGYTVTLTFQRHYVDPGKVWDRPARGFLRGASTRYGRYRCASYGGDISCGLDERFALEWTLDLLERAAAALRTDERAYKALCAKGHDKILFHVAGFQRIGIGVKVYNEHMRPTAAHRRAA